MKQYGVIRDIRSDTVGMEHVGKFDDTVCVISRNTQSYPPRKFKSKGSAKERICAGSGHIVRTSFRLVEMQRACICISDYRYRDFPSVMFGIFTDSDYFACASDAPDAESEKLKCISECNSISNSADPVTVERDAHCD